MQLNVQKFRTGARTVLQVQDRPKVLHTKQHRGVLAGCSVPALLTQTLASSAVLLPEPIFHLQRHQHFWSYPGHSLQPWLTSQRAQGSHKVQDVEFCADLGNFYPSCRASGVKLLTETGNMTRMGFPPWEGLRAALRCINCSCRWWFWHSLPQAVDKTS